MFEWSGSSLPVRPSATGHWRQLISCCSWLHQNQGWSSGLIAPLLWKALSVRHFLFLNLLLKTRYFFPLWFDADRVDTCFVFLLWFCCHYTALWFEFCVWSDDLLKQSYLFCFYTVPTVQHLLCPGRRHMQPSGQGVMDRLKDSVKVRGDAGQTFRGSIWKVSLESGHDCVHSN